MRAQLSASFTPLNTIVLDARGVSWDPLIVEICCLGRNDQGTQSGGVRLSIDWNINIDVLINYNRLVTEPQFIHWYSY